MNDLRINVGKLFENREIDLFVGYGEGTRMPRPAFVHSADETERLIFDDRCTGNLAVYLTRKDIIRGGKVGIAASHYTLKSILQLFAENQLSSETLRIFVVSPQGGLVELDSPEDIETHLKNTPAPAKEADEELRKRLEAMTREERWEFWSAELSKCFKCYACRAACPMCYCTRCIVDVNRPQWVQPWAAVQANMEWHISRAMHMAGRCADCGSCGSACPLGIPIHLLSRYMAETVEANFGKSTGNGNVLSTFRPTDKEAFIL